MPNFLLAGCLLFAVTDWLAVARGWRAVEYLAKPATLALLLLYAASAPNPAWWLIAALTLSLLGDVYLMLPDDLFVPGLVAFLLAHIAYIIGFDASVLPRLVWSIVLLAVCSPLAWRIMRSVESAALRAAVGLYLLIIAVMVGSAIATGAVLAALGALLFFASDTLIAWNRFVRPYPWARVAIMVTYHVGQFGLVVALRA